MYIKYLSHFQAHGPLLALFELIAYIVTYQQSTGTRQLPSQST